MINTPNIRLANIEDLPELAKLFDDYRQFYEQPSDVAKAHDFLAARMQQGESVIFLAEESTAGLIGFCQLYPTFCSVLAAKTATLYDLFVAHDARQSGAGRALMLAAANYAKANRYARLELTTAHTNTKAQHLYESLGWEKDEVFRAYALML